MSFYNELTEVVVTCFDHSIKEVSDLMVDGLVSEPGSRWNFIEERFEPRSIYFPAPPIGGVQSLMFALWQPANAEGRCAFIANCEDGMSQFIFNLHREHRLGCLLLRFTRSTIERGIASFIRLSPDGSERIVRCLQEDRWQFYENGAVLPFEDVGHYRKRIIKDRLPENLLVTYAALLDWDIKSDDFWHSNTAAIVGRERPWRSA